ncbi:MAG: endonuclease/exonuclease/phosphatase family protein [Cyanobacteria bacterium HKST-UBA02]|nr:endonuclease/exonuclease/phosphatase family protein [Cyanobacteria bacterium HKST-UBA02]
METQPDNLPAEERETLPAEPEKKAAPKKKSRGSRIAFDISLTCAFVALIVIVITIAGMMSGSMRQGDLGYICEQCANFRALCAWILMVTVIPPLFSLPWRPLAAVSMIFALINFASVAPVFMSKDKSADKDAMVFSFKLLQIENGDQAFPLEDVISLVSGENPEIFTISGIKSAEMVTFNEQPKLAYYQYRKVDPRADGYGLGIYAKVPVLNSFTRPVGPDKIPVLFSTVKFDFGWVRIVVFRSPEVAAAADMDRRNNFLAALGEEIAKLEGPVLVSANLNATPYTGTYEGFLKAARLEDTRAGFGMQPNCYLGPGDLYFNRVPFDYTLVNNLVGVDSRWIATGYGHQRLPIVGKFYLREHKVEYKDLPVPAAESGASKAPASQSKAPAAESKADKKPESKPGKRGRRKKH